MENEVSKEAIENWNEVTRLWHEYVIARYNLNLKHRSELPALVKQKLGHPTYGHLAFEIANTLTPEEKQTLLPALVSLCGSAKHAHLARPIIFEMSHDWLIENIEIAAEPTLAQNDFLDWVQILGVYADIDLSLARRLAHRMIAHADSDIREWGEEFLDDHKET